MTSRARVSAHVQVRNRGGRNRNRNFFALSERERGTVGRTSVKNSVRGSSAGGFFRLAIRGQSADILQIGELINIVAWFLFQA